MTYLKNDLKNVTIKNNRKKGIVRRLLAPPVYFLWKQTRPWWLEMERKVPST